MMYASRVRLKAVGTLMHPGLGSSPSRIGHKSKLIAVKLLLRVKKLPQYRHRVTHPNNK